MTDQDDAIRAAAGHTPPVWIPWHPPHETKDFVAGYEACEMAIKMENGDQFRYPHAAHNIKARHPAAPDAKCDPEERRVIRLDFNEREARSACGCRARRQTIGERTEIVVWACEECRGVNARLPARAAAPVAKLLDQEQAVITWALVWAEKMDQLTAAWRASDPNWDANKRAQDVIELQKACAELSDEYRRLAEGAQTK